MIKLNTVIITPTIFPDKTSQVWKIEAYTDSTYNLVTWDFESESELIHLAQLKDYLDSIKAPAFLYIPYLPYARQDKDISNESTFALYTFAKLINSLNFKKVSSIDAHSNIANKLINNFESYEVSDEMLMAYLKSESNMVVYPDKGALERYSYNNYDYAYAEKVRNQSSGIIESYKLIGNVKNKNVLICDDLCDGGATFIKLSNLLKEAGVNKISLYTTHGIYSKGKQVLLDAGIQEIYNYKGEVK